MADTPQDILTLECPRLRSYQVVLWSEQDLQPRCAMTLNCLMTAEQMAEWLGAMYCNQVIRTQIRSNDLSCYISYAHIQSVDQEIDMSTPDHDADGESPLCVTVVIEGDVSLSMSTSL